VFKLAEIGEELQFVGGVHGSRLRAALGPHADAWLRGDARDRDGGFRRLYFHVGNLSATA
jgi:hypothetical protein